MLSSYILDPPPAFPSGPARRSTADEYITYAIVSASLPPQIELHPWKPSYNPARDKSEAKGMVPEPDLPSRWPPEFVFESCFPPENPSRAEKESAVMNGKSVKRAKTAAAIAAVIAAGAVGCRLSKNVPSTAAPPAQSLHAVADAVAQGASGLAAVQGHTQSAEVAVQQAAPHADPVGKAHLVTASMEHAAVLAEGTQLQQALDGLLREVEAANDRAASAQEQTRAAADELLRQQQVQRELESQWYVRGGRWSERMFWTIAVGYLAASVASALVGLGNPLSWIGRFRGLIGGAGPSAGGWIGSAFVK